MDPANGIFAQTKKLSDKDQRDPGTMAGQIASSEVRLARATDESGRPENMSNAITLVWLAKEMADAQAGIDQLYSRWAELEG